MPFGDTGGVKDGWAEYGEAGEDDICYKYGSCTLLPLPCREKLQKYIGIDTTM